MTAKDDTLVKLLDRWNDGDRLAEEQVLGLAYPELHRIARMFFRRERRNHTLEPTAVINESYIQLTEHYGIKWRSRTHFFGVMAGLMRRVLIDYHRQRHALRRGNPHLRVSLDQAHDVPNSEPSSLLALEEALTRLSEIDPQKADLVELRFFGGLTIDETAAFLGISTATVERHWRRARAWLYEQLEGSC